jgi:protein phosphatase
MGELEEKTHHRERFPVPVVGLDVGKLSHWADFVSGNRTSLIDGFNFNAFPENFAINVNEFWRKPDPQECLDTFWLIASSEAKRLALRLSACPIVSLEIIREIRQNFVMGSTEVHEAEVFLAGILEVSGNINVLCCEPSKLEYVFRGNIRERLLEGLSLRERIDVFLVPTVSEWFRDKLELDAITVLTQPLSVQGVLVRSAPSPEIQALIMVLKDFGTEYAQIFPQNLDSRTEMIEGPSGADIPSTLNTVDQGIQASSEVDTPSVMATEGTEESIIQARDRDGGPLLSGKIMVYGHTVRGPRHEENEDVILVGHTVCTSGEVNAKMDWGKSAGAREGMLVAVADGMGSEASGAAAARIALESLDAYFHKEVREVDLRAMANALYSAAKWANSLVLDFGKRQEHYNGMACTLSGVLILGDEYLVFNAGDSRVYRYSHGILRQMTEDDSVVADAVRKGELTLAQADSSRFRNYVTNAVGAKTFRLRLGERQWLLPGDALVVCSDGLHNVVSLNRMERLLAEYGTAKGRCRALVEAASESGDYDDLSVIVVNAED